MRSFLFNVAFYGFTALIAVLCLPLLIIPARKPLVLVLHYWAKGIVLLMRLLAGIRIEYRGKDHIPAKGPALLAGKHQSYADGILVLAVIPDIAVVAIKVLLKYPIIGSMLKKLEMIMVDTCGGGKERNGLAERAEKAYARGRPILIYPEGQLVPVGEKAPYKNGIYHLYANLDLPVVPIASNIGLCWSQRNWRKTPGCAVVEFLPPIPAGYDKNAFMERLEQIIETATAKLVEEAR